MTSTATLRQARVSAQKARLVANLIRGRDLGEALEILAFTRKKSAPMIKALLESAVANAEHAAEKANEKLDIDDLIVKTITVDEGPVLRRWRPRARGMATKIQKKSSHITVVLDADLGS